MQEPFEDLDMEEIIETFYGVSNGNSDGNEESDNDLIIEHLKMLTSTPVCEGSRALVL